MFDDFELRTEPSAYALAADAQQRELQALSALEALRRSHYDGDLSPHERELLVPAITDGIADGTIGGPVATNALQRPFLLRAAGLPSHGVVDCPRCKRRGRTRPTNVDDLHVCHPPFARNGRQTYERDALAIGCKTCNEEDGDNDAGRQ